MSAVPDRSDEPFSHVPHSHFEVLREARHILQSEGQALLHLAKQLDASFCQAVELIGGTAGTVVVTGLGKAGHIGHKITATLCSSGTRARFLHPTEAMHGDLGCLAAGDVILALSNSGETAEVNQLLPIFRTANLPVVAITGSDRSTLGRQAQVVLPLGRLVEVGVEGLAPSTSTTAMLALGDALAFCVSQQKRFTHRHFAALHPGGSLGRRLTPVRELMRSGEQVRIAHESTVVRDVFVRQRRPGRRTGAVMLVDDAGLLTGIFTDSDLARLLERRLDGQLDRPIGEVMTRGPKTVGPDVLFEELCQMLGEKRISELPVVDAEGRPIGMVDITDVIGSL